MKIYDHFSFFELKGTYIDGLKGALGNKILLTKSKTTHNTVPENYEFKSRLKSRYHRLIYGPQGEKNTKQTFSWYFNVTMA